LTGVEAGARDEQGAYPEGTINAKIEARLQTFAEQRREFALDETPDDASS